MRIVNLLYSIADISQLPPITQKEFFITSLLNFKCIQHYHKALDMFQIDPI
jgi:hypothetical protein